MLLDLGIALSSHVAFDNDDRLVKAAQHASPRSRFGGRWPVSENGSWGAHNQGSAVAGGRIIFPRGSSYPSWQRARRGDCCSSCRKRSCLDGSCRSVCTSPGSSLSQSHWRGFGGECPVSSKPCRDPPRH